MSERGATGPRAAVRISATSVAVAAEAHLRGLLFQGAWAAGTELRDTVLARELGIARPTVRAAIHQLIAEGLLEREPGHSARVRSFTTDDVRDIYLVRRLIEFEAVRAIMTSRRSTARIHLALEAFARAGDSWEAGPDADTRFHSAVVAAAGSSRLTRTFDGLASEMRLMIGLLRSRYRGLAELYEEHAQLLNGIESGDRARALRLWGQHIDDAEAHVLNSLDVGASARS